MNPQQVLRVHEVAVEARLGSGAYGDTYGPPFALRCFAEGRVRMVRDPDGNEVVSSLTLYTQQVQADAIPAGSIVTWRGNRSKVIASIPHDTGGLATEVDHVEVACE